MNKESEQSRRRKRQGNQQGHTVKFLTIVDESPECASAVYFAACRARRIGGKVVLLFVVEPEGFQHWLSVEELHREEGEQKAEAVFRLYRMKLAGWGFDDIVADERVAHGDPREVLVTTIDEDEDISFLVLGASTSNEGPGKLVSWVAGQQAGSFPVPVVLIPGAMAFEDIEALT